MPPRPPQIELHDSMVLTQLGMRLPGQAHFTVAPRRGREHDVSLLLSRLDAREAALAVRHGRREFYQRDIVRHTTVGRLREAGFRVVSTPSKMIPHHVSVEYDGDWTDDGDVAKRFDDCFG